MRFPGRQPRDYAIPAAGDELELGSIYYTVAFIDAEGKVPEWFTPVFIEKAVSAAKQTLYFFQDAGSYLNGRRHTDKDITGEVRPKLVVSRRHRQLPVNGQLDPTETSFRVRQRD